MKNRKATFIESTLLILAAIGGGLYVGQIAKNNLSQEESPTVYRITIVDYVQSTSPVLEI